ncbi:MAG: class I SAM-dependent methyltransferase [Candidatus Omnitrophica bacterium]|nr:class I SAM-dependent methyltransferase [Candidatus Omnitrophota bacterium]
MIGSPLTRGRTLDHVAGVYDALSPLMLFGQERAMSRPCFKFLEDQRIRSVLDIGCGTGTLTIEIGHLLAARSGRVSGVDAAPKMIDAAAVKARGLSNVYFDVAAAEALPYADASFDHALSTFFFHHIDFELKLRALNEAYRVLKPGGFLVIIDVDVPTNMFGRLCAWAGYFLFQQEEIRENIEGKLRLAMEVSRFDSFEAVSHHQGYISVFKLTKGVEV